MFKWGKREKTDVVQGFEWEKTKKSDVIQAFKWLFPVYSTCIFCGREDINSTETGLCSICSKTAPYIDCPNATFAYDGKMERCIKGLKYDNKRYLAEIFAGLSRDKISKFSYDIVCFVPTLNEKKRGYNQAELIARAIDNEHTVNALDKIRDTVSQTTLSAKERMENVKGAYAAKDVALVKGKRILLVDDVYTTGSTIKECARMLTEAGAKEVILYTICKTVFKNDE